MITVFWGCDRLALAAASTIHFADMSRLHDMSSQAGGTPGKHDSQASTFSLRDLQTVACISNVWKKDTYVFHLFDLECPRSRLLGR